MGRNRYLVKNTTMIGAGSIISKLTQFIVLSLCTYSLTTGEFGIADICVSTAALLYPVFSLEISQAVFRFTIDKQDNDKSIITFSLCVSIIGGIIAFMLTPIMTGIPEVGQYWIAIALLAVLEAMQLLVKEYTRAKEDGRNYVLGGVINSVVQISACVMLVYFLKYGAWGYFISLSLGYIGEFIFLAFSMQIIKNFSVKSIDSQNVREMLVFSVPLIPNTIMWWIVSISDRYFVLYMIGDSAAGLYSVAAKIPALITVVTGIFFKAWQMSAIDIEKEDDVSEYSSKVFNYLWVVGGICIVLVLIFLRVILYVLVAEEFRGAWIYATVLIVSAGFASLQSFIGTAYTVYKDSIGCLRSTVLMASMNIVFNYIFIRIWGIQGAAYSTLISYVFVTVYRYIDTRKYLVLKVDIVRMTLTYILLIITSLMPLINSTIYYPMAIFVLISLLIINKQEVIRLATMVKKLAKR